VVVSSVLPFSALSFFILPFLMSPHDNLALLHFKASLTMNDDRYCDQVYPTIATWENGTDCCSWSGVTCHPISGHVTAIDLACAGLQGQINANSTPFHSFSYAITQSCFQ